jgi:glycosyltransferase involved in cell wall biosynthesis
VGKLKLARTFSIITTCKSRLEHLRQSLPKMLTQNCKEVIVVDYSCPQGTGEFVTDHFPSVRVVSVPGETHFSNWKARNAGAAAATGDVLVFADADTILADGAIDWLDANLPERTYGFFPSQTSRSFNRGGPRLAANQLRGFHVIPRGAFERLGGYDEVLQGYAAGADTDLEERLGMIRLSRHALDRCMIESVIEHDLASRTQHHAQPVPKSYCAGLLYRAAKRIVLRVRGGTELPIDIRRNLYDGAQQAAAKLGGSVGSNNDRIGMTVKLGQDPVLMPRQLGYERGMQNFTLTVEIALENKLPEIPE